MNKIIHIKQEELHLILTLQKKTEKVLRKVIMIGLLKICKTQKNCRTNKSVHLHGFISLYQCVFDFIMANMP